MTPFAENPAVECSETLADLSRRLTTLADFMNRCDRPSAPRPARQTQSPATLARAVLQARRKREALFPDLFADPAWDVLLDLFVAAEEGHELSVTSACVGASVPATTALRSITLLERRGLVVRRPHPTDGRGILLSLSDEAHQRMSQWCAQIGRFT